jgi:hypothetical protein
MMTRGCAPNVRHWRKGAARNHKKLYRLDLEGN